MEMRTISHIAGLGTAMVWGMTFVCTKVLLEYLTPLDILVCRTILGFLALSLLRPHILKLQERKHELLFVAAGFTGAFGYYLLENTALVYADASVISVVSSTAPLFTAILGFVAMREEGFGPRFVAGFVIAISGIALISFSSGPGHASLLGVGLGLMGAMTWAIYSLVVKKLSNLGYETLAMTKRTFAWGLVFLVGTRVVVGGDVPLSAFTEPAVLGNLAFLGLLASAGCFVTWNVCVKHLGPTYASAYIYLQAPLTVLWAAILLGEPVTPSIVFGIALVIVGLALSEGFDRSITALVKARFARR